MNHRRAFLTLAAVAALAFTAATLPFAHARPQILATIAHPAPPPSPGDVGGTGSLPVDHNFNSTTSPTAQAAPHAVPVGMFESSADIGTVLHPGSAACSHSTDPDDDHCHLTASGENIWGTSDAFHFAYKKTSGDIDLSADVSFFRKGKNPHRKAVLMIRKSLDPGSPYVDAALHGTGLLSLQYRESPGGPTTEIETLSPLFKKELPMMDPSPLKVIDVTAGIKMRLVKRGRYAYLYISSPAETAAGAEIDGEWAPGTQLVPSGASIPMPFDGDFYVGLGLSSHDADAIEEASFYAVTLKDGPAPTTVAGLPAPQLYSTLEVVDIDSTIRHIRYVQPTRFEAPNWTRDGSSFLFNREGRIWSFPAVVPDAIDAPDRNHIPRAGMSFKTAKPAEPIAIDTGFATRCNNDHGISPDGTQIVVSDNSQDTHDSIVYTLPITGATAASPPHRITKKSPSYWHGWSPDGKTLAFVGQRNGDFDIYTLPADATNSAQETRLTTAKGLDDGPEYTPDGQWIYFNSERTGHMQIWRMHADGSAQEQVTHDDSNNWFPHFSPDGKWMVMLSYDKTVEGHPENKDVQLRLMSMADGKITPLARLFGGQGTINVPSWSPDSKHLAFVSYELLPREPETPAQTGANR